MTDEKANTQFVVGGYTFSSEQLAQDAKNELNAIKYMSSKTNTGDPAQAFLLYNKIIDKKLFKTPVGMDYLKELQHFLYVSREIPNDKIRPIPVDLQLQEMLGERQAARKNRDYVRQLEQNNKKNRDLFIKSMILNIFLVVVVIAMILIAMSSANPNIINYENQLIDKYEEWNNQLESKENKLNQMEKELESRYNIDIK